MPTFDGPLRRETIRLRGFDYGVGYSYFITICTVDRVPLLGHVDTEGIAHESDAGRIVRAAWGALADRFPMVHSDSLVVMPDHIHAILTVADHSDAPHEAVPSLSRIIGVLKSTSTVTINRQRKLPGEPVWQRSFHDRVIRNEAEYLHLCGYIADNPLRWALARRTDEDDAGAQP